LITTSFEVSSEHLDPVECSRVIGLDPTACSTKPEIKGKWLPSGQPNIIDPFWRLQLTQEPAYEIDEGLTKILDMLWPHRHRVLRVIRRSGYSAGFSSSVTIFEGRPVYSLSPRSLSRLSYFGLEWGLDVFDLSQ
jgi:hypothetical protein